MTSSLLLVGCGKMGGALLSRWRHTHPAGIHRFRVIEPAQSHTNSNDVHWFRSLDDLPVEFTPDIVVFAVKPQELAGLLPAYGERYHEKMPLYISIAAGKSLKFFIAQLGGRAHVVRAMPNMPASIGEGITTLCALSSVPASLKNIATQLMQAVGDTVWLENESLMDVATALSGSGPAYVFLFLESLVRAAVGCGLPEETARKLAIKTVAGSCALAAQGSDSFETLRRRIASPGGTTEAALALLMQDGRFEKMVAEAVQKAAKRSQELK